MKPDVRKCKDLDTLGKKGAEFVLKAAEKGVKEKGLFTIALSGGRAPLKFHEHLSSPPIKDKMPWKKIHIFWNDDRCVPPNHKDSNYAMAERTLLSKIDIPEENIHRIPTEVRPPQRAAKEYEDHIRSFFRTFGSSEKPTFDLLVMGVGPDGHTASLFPGDPILDEDTRLVAAVEAPEGFVIKNRITLTLPLINMAECVIFLASGPENQKVVTSILEDPDKSQALYPAALVYPRGKLIWFLDESISS